MKRTPFRVNEVDKKTPATGLIWKFTVPDGQILIIEGCLLENTSRSSWCGLTMTPKGESRTIVVAKGRAVQGIHGQFMWHGRFTVFGGESISAYASDITVDDVCNAQLWGYFEYD